MTAEILGKKRNHANRIETMNRAVQLVLDGMQTSLKDIHWYNRYAAPECLFGVATSIGSLFHLEQCAPNSLWFLAEFPEEIRPIIPMVVDLLSDDDSRIHVAAIASDFLQEIRSIIPTMVALLRDDHPARVQEAAVECLATLGAHFGLEHISSKRSGQQFPWLSNHYRATVGMFVGLQSSASPVFLGHNGIILPAITSVMKLLHNTKPDVCQAAVEFFVTLAGQAQFQKEVHAAITMVAKLLGDDTIAIRQAAIECLIGLGVRGEYFQGIRAAVAKTVHLLTHYAPQKRASALDSIAALSPHAELQEDLDAAIPTIVKLLEHTELGTRQAACRCFSALAVQGSLDPARSRISAADPGNNPHSSAFAEGQALSFRNPSDCYQVPMWSRSASVCVAEFHEEIRTVVRRIPEMVKSTSNSDHGNAFGLISSLGTSGDVQFTLTASWPLRRFWSRTPVGYPGVNSPGRAIGQKERLRTAFQSEIRPAIPVIVNKIVFFLEKATEWDEGNGSFPACLIDWICSIASQAQFHHEIRAVIPMVVASMRDHDLQYCQNAVGLLSGLGAGVHRNPGLDHTHTASIHADFEIVLIQILDLGHSCDHKGNVKCIERFEPA
ncbi:armadillo-type protein [Mycena sanguinolenta]|nr:armadillo-type protein [Mycena sanguinolenta]